MATTTFTIHGLQRTQQRLSISPSQVADLLDDGLYIDVGVEPGTSKRHRLFYSPCDGFCFIAIQDASNGEVVTVLPLAYHDNLAWPVLPDQERAAREIILPHARRFSVKREDRNPAHSDAKVFRALAYVSIGARLRIAHLGTWPSLPYQRRVERLTRDRCFLVELRSRLEDKIKPNEDIESVYVRLGNRGPVTAVELSR